MSEQNVRLESEYTGQTFGQSDIQINPRVDGVIESLNFKEGSIVSKGQLLYTIDPLPYQAKVNRLKGYWQNQRLNWQKQNQIWT